MLSAASTRSWRWAGSAETAPANSSARVIATMCWEAISTVIPADGLRLRNGMKRERRRWRFFLMPGLSDAGRKSCLGSSPPRESYLAKSSGRYSGRMRTLFGEKARPIPLVLMLARQEGRAHVLEKLAHGLDHGPVPVADAGTLDRRLVAEVAAKGTATRDLHRNSGHGALKQRTLPVETHQLVNHLIRVFGPIERRIEDARVGVESATLGQCPAEVACRAQEAQPW